MTPLREYVPGNDYTHKMSEPWNTLALVKSDLRQARGQLRRVLVELAASHTAPGEQSIRSALHFVGVALGRIGGEE